MVELCGERKTDAYSTYRKGDVMCLANTFVQAGSSFHRMQFSAKNPTFGKLQNVMWQIKRRQPK
jgi:hypothetical protein